MKQNLGHTATASDPQPNDGRQALKLPLLIGMAIRRKKKMSGEISPTYTTLIQSGAYSKTTVAVSRSRSRTVDSFLKKNPP
jgi:hypothetical protein